ncbi:hypothetical protein ABZ926_35845 [Streptomyces litmocidini]|uniref:hypothetical protein n=1 Tax=Streptomyces litmocidini TaxID=67318 RepID=UPI0033C41E49
MTGYQTAGVNARLRLLAVLAAAGVDDGQADDLLAAVEAGAVAGAHTWAVEEEEAAPVGCGEAYERGWFDGVATVCTVLASVADHHRRQTGRAAAARLLVEHHAARPAAATEGDSTR